MRALALYYLLSRRAMNVSRIISFNMDEMAQSATKKSLGHTIFILLLCKKESLSEFTDGRIMNPTRVLDDGGIAEHPRRTSLDVEALETEENPTETTGPNRP